MIFVAPDGLVDGLVFALVVPLDESEVVGASVAPVFEDVVGLHPEAVQSHAVAVCPTQAAELVRALVRVAVVGVCAIMAVVADGDVRFVWCGCHRSSCFPLQAFASCLGVDSPEKSEKGHQVEDLHGGMGDK